MISPEDRLRICATVQAEFGNASLAGIVCALAAGLGVEKALLEFNRALTHPRVQTDRPAN